MKRYIIFIGGFVALTGCITQRQHHMELRALDSVKRLNIVGAITDSVYTLKK